MNSLKRKSIPCKFCSKEVSLPKNRWKSFKYCSRRCLALGMRVQIEKNCDVCGVVFTHISSRCNSAKYCSRKCYYKSLRGKGSVKYSCFHCKKTFFGSPSKRRKYCSRRCINKEAKEKWNPAFSTVRKAMLARGMLEQCEKCGFNLIKDILGVHHKDRNKNNNSLKNLIVLCPNCHSIEHMKHIVHGGLKKINWPD